MSDAVLEATAKAYNATRGNVLQAALAANIARATMEGRVRECRRRRPELLQNFDEAPSELPATLPDAVARHRSRESAAAARARLKDALRRIAELEDRLADMEWAASGAAEAADWPLRARPNRKREHIPYLLTSDFHAGEVVSAADTDAGYGYDPATFSRRYRGMIDTTIYLSFQHGGKGWVYPGIVYARGGDSISGAIHDELRETDGLRPLEAVELVFAEEAAGIRKLLEAFGKVEVKTFDAAGNHDRDTLKPRSKNAGAHSYDRLVSYMLRREFAGNKRVTFQRGLGFDVRFQIYGRRILLTHGDRMGSRGGQGFIGPAATILRGVQKVMAEQAALGFHIDEVHHGHFHYPMTLPFVISNGSLPGFTEYAKSFRMRPQPPQQMLCFYHEKRGVVDYKPLILV